MKPRRFRLTLRDRFGMPLNLRLTVWADSGDAAFRLFNSQSAELGRRWAESAHHSEKEDAYALAR